MKDDDVIIAEPEPVPKKESSPVLLDVSVGHSEQARGASGNQNGIVLSEWGQSHHRIRPALQVEATKPSSGFSLRFWDAKENPQWGEPRGRDGNNLLLYDRLVAMYRDESVNPKVDIAIALHNNASKNTDYGGFMMIYRREEDGEEDEAGKSLAQHLCKAFAKAFPKMKNRGEQADTGSWVSRDLAFTRWGFRYDAIPIIIEFGFMTCANDREIMIKDDTPEKYAQAVLFGVSAFVAEERKNGYRK